MMRLYTTAVLVPVILLACAFPFALNNFGFANIIGMACLFWLLFMTALAAGVFLVAEWLDR